MTLTNDLHIAAALAEQSYRRADADQQIQNEDIGASNVSLTAPMGGVQRDDITGFYYNNATGFVGRVVIANGKVFVAFRGTDMAGGISDLIAAKVGFERTSAIDVKDFDCANSPLCFGTSSASQLDDALALTRAAKTFAASEGMELVVAGQSLGGGLAGLVSAIENVKSYLLAPAPFQNQLEIQATLFALEKNGVPLADLKTGTPPIDDSILRAGDLNLKNWIHAFRPQYDGVMDAVLLDRTLKLTSLESTLRDQATLYLNEGEALTSGSISTTIDAFSDHFDLTPTKINLGDGSSVSLHGPALHNLAIRTYGSAQAFDALLRNDKALRAAFLDIIAITGTIDNMRADPEGSSSRMGSSGPNPAVMENALWKTVGLQGGFYEQFYARFGSWLSSGAVANGKSDTSLNDFTVHSGLVKLGLQVVRDAINHTSLTDPVVNAKGLNVFGEAGQDLAAGPRDGYVRIDLADITAKGADGQVDARLKDSANGKAFGVRDIDTYVWTQARFQPSTTLIPSVATKVVAEALGLPPIGGTDTETNLRTGLQSLPAWQVLVAQAKGGDAMTYAATGDFADKSHVIIGGTAGDTIAGSTVRDYILAGNGADTLMSGGGNDVIVGGAGNDRYVAKPLTTQLQGNVTFIGGPDIDTAAYGDEFASYRFEFNIRSFDRLYGQTGIEVNIGGTVSETLIGTERIELGKGLGPVEINRNRADLGSPLSLNRQRRHQDPDRSGQQRERADVGGRGLQLLDRPSARLDRAHQARDHDRG